FQELQSPRQHAGGHGAERFHEILESARPAQQVPHNQQCPAFADDLERQRHRTPLPVCSRHASMVSGFGRLESSTSKKRVTGLLTRQKSALTALDYNGDWRCTLTLIPDHRRIPSIVSRSWPTGLNAGRTSRSGSWCSSSISSMTILARAP